MTSKTRIVIAPMWQDSAGDGEATASRIMRPYHPALPGAGLVCLLERFRPDLTGPGAQVGAPSRHRRSQP
ncbi:hypothetical protein [Noviherbaspirillum aerium]|uniref:hypothetical protein n=1 Tax=Noviherbaspirillum aerium TaxID=2588497 RepID=UPI00178C1D72|nr:hypothetical protein [Noviherbaspirillum aerium]